MKDWFWLLLCWLADWLIDLIDGQNIIRFLGKFIFCFQWKLLGMFVYWLDWTIVTQSWFCSSFWSMWHRRPGAVLLLLSLGMTGLLFAILVIIASRAWRHFGSKWVDLRKFIWMLDSFVNISFLVHNEFVNSQGLLSVSRGWGNWFSTNYNGETGCHGNQ